MTIAVTPPNPLTGGATLTQVVQIFESSGIYNPSNGMMFAEVECIGGGGAGGGVAMQSTTTAGGGGGGGAGSYSRRSVGASLVAGGVYAPLRRGDGGDVES